MARSLKKNFPGIITGASTGIGRALAVRLAERHKAKLVLTARSTDDLEKTKSMVEAKGGQAVCVVGDIASADIQNEIVERCLAEFGGIDLLVNNAGLARPGLVKDLSPEVWRQVFEVNFFAALQCTYLALPHFVKQNYGKIVNVSSVAGKIAFAGSVCYSASKFAMTAMSEGMAAEFSSSNIDVLTVCPGWVRTEFFEKNNVIDQKNPTLIAAKNDLQGFLMRHVLSISAKESADEIERALAKGGSHELIMTYPGKVIERLAGVSPPLVAFINRNLPLKHVDSSTSVGK